MTLKHAIPGASQLPGFASAKAETTERRAFELFGDGAYYECLQVAGEVFGRLGKDAVHVLSDPGDVVASDSCASKSAFVRTERQELSCALCLGNAGMYDRPCSRWLKMMGGVLSPGWRGQLTRLVTFSLGLSPSSFLS